MALDNWALLDLRGLVLTSMFGGSDPDAEQDAEGNDLPTPGYVLDRFVTNYLAPITEMYRLGRVIAVHDRGSLHRKMLYPQYKAHRKPLSEAHQAATKAALQAVTDFLNALGITQCYAKGVEADDLIARFAEKLPGFKRIYTVDNDLVALASPRVEVVIRGESKTGMKKGDLFIPPERITLFKSLCGDSSDGYKGVPGFGPAAYATIAEAFGEEGLDTLQQIIETKNVAELEESIDDSKEGRLLSKLPEHFQEWWISWELAKFHPEWIDCNLGLTLKEIAEHEEDVCEYGYNRTQWVKRLPSPERMQKVLEKANAVYLFDNVLHLLPQRNLITMPFTDDDLAEFRILAESSPFVALDWETVCDKNENFNKAKSGKGDFVDMLTSKIVGAGFTLGLNQEQTFYFSFGHANDNNLPKSALPLLLDCIPAGTPIVAHNGYFERNVLMADLGCDLPDLHDTKILASHVDENEEAGLKELAKRLFRYDQVHYDEVIEPGKTMADYSAEHVFSYGADDPFVTAHLYDLFYTITNLEGSWEFIKENEFPSVYVLSDAYLAGVEVDWPELMRQSEEDKATLEANLTRLRELLQANQTPETIELGVKNLIDEYSIGKDKPREVLEQELREKLTYAPYRAIEKEIAFKPTVAQLTKVAAILGLPAVTTIKNTPMGCYIRENRGVSDKADRFLSLLGDCLEYLKDDSAPEHRRLKDFCCQVLREQLPEGKGVVFTGTELNINSPVQNKNLLYGMLHLPIRIRDFEISETRKAAGVETGSLKANEDAVLWALANDVQEGDWRKEALSCFLNAKKCDTRIKLFYNKYLLWQHPDTGCVHAQFNSVGTETRRPTGSSPNLLQLPKRGEGLKFRKCLKPNSRLGHDLVVSIDFSQEEVRFLAGLSGDTNLLSCYVGDHPRDVHSMAALMKAGMDYETFEQRRKDESDPDHKKLTDTRRKAKTTVFLSQYGGGAPKLSRELVEPVEVAKEYLAAYAEAYPDTFVWKEEVIAETHRKGYIDTLLGCRRHFYDQLLVTDEGLLGHTERQAINYAIQGLAADVLKRTLADLWRARTFQRYNAVLLAPIYDELAFTCNSEQVADLLPEVMHFMTKAVPGLPVPIIAEASLGTSFGDQVELGSAPTAEEIMAAVERVLGKPDRQVA